MITISKLLRLTLISLALLSAAYLSLPLWLAPLTNRIIAENIEKGSTLTLDGVHLSYQGIFIERIAFSAPDHELLLIDTVIQSIFSGNPKLRSRSLSGTLGISTTKDASPTSSSTHFPFSNGSLAIANLSLQIHDQMKLSGSLTASLSKESLLITTDLNARSSHSRNTLPDLQLQGSLSLSEDYSRILSAYLELESESFDFSFPHHQCTLDRSSVTLELDQKQAISASALLHCKDDVVGNYEVSLACESEDSLLRCAVKENEKPSLQVEVITPSLKESYDTWTIKKISINDAVALSGVLSRYTELPIVLSSLEIEPDASLSLLKKTISIPAFTIRVSGLYNHISVEDLSLQYQVDSTGSLYSPLQLDLAHLPTKLEARGINVVTNTSMCSFSDISGKTESLNPLIASIHGKSQCVFGPINLPETRFSCNTRLQDIMDCVSKDKNNPSLHYEFSIPFESLAPKYVVLKKFQTEDAALLRNALQAFLPTATLSEGKLSASGSFNVLKNALSTIISIQDLQGTVQDVAIKGASSRIPLTFNEEGFHITNGTITVGTLEAGLPLKTTSAVLTFHSNPQVHCSLSTVQSTLFLGSLSIPTIFCDQRALNQALDVSFSALNLEALTTWLHVATFKARGLLSGSFPLSINDGTLSLNDGTFSLGESGGFLSIVLGDSYDSVMIPGFEFSVKTMLASLQLKELNAKVSYKQSILDSTISLLGSNPQVRNGYPLKLTVTLSQNLKALLKTLSISKVFRKRTAGN